MDENKAQAVVQHMTDSVKHIEDAASAAEAVLQQTSDHIRSITQDVSPDDSDAVDECFTKLDEFASELEDKANELSSAIVANTPADPSATPPASTISGDTVNNLGGGGSDQAGDQGSTTTASLSNQGSGADGETLDSAAQAGGYSVGGATAPAAEVDNTPPPAAGQHPDVAPEDAQPENSTLTEAEGTEPTPDSEQPPEA